MKSIIGEIRVPGDKSISHRAALFSSFAAQTCEFENFNFNLDCTATLNCLRSLGINWEFSSERLKVHGKPISEWQLPQFALDAKNSGTTARLISGILVNLNFETSLVGDESLRLRPMQRVINPLMQMGARIESNKGLLPLKFYPSSEIKGIQYAVPMASAQVKSAVLLAGLFAGGKTEVIESKVTRDHTERILNLEKCENKNGTVSIFSSQKNKIPDISMRIPGDFSSAAFLIVAALILPGSELTIRDVSLNPTRTGLLKILELMGAKIETVVETDKPEPIGSIHVRYQKLENIEIPIEEVPNIIDEVPILSLLATQCEGPFLLRGAEELRYKESDRLKSIVNNFRALGINFKEYEDGLEITGPHKLSGGRIVTLEDHRIAMTFAIASQLIEENIVIDNPDCADVSFPGFYNLLNTLIR